eukprot:RCo013330
MFAVHRPLERILRLPLGDRLLLGLFALTCLFFVVGVLLPIVSLDGRFTAEAPLSVRKSTVQSVYQFLSGGFWVPGVLVLVFSLMLPMAKIGFLVVLFAPAFRGLTGPEIHSPWMRRGVSLLRKVAKYQLLDVFVTVLMVAYLNQNVLVTQVQPGFLFYVLFCGLSMLLASLVEPRLGDSLSGSEHFRASARLSKPDLWFVRADCGMFLAGMGYALVSPVLAVKVTFQHTLVISESSLSIAQIVVALFGTPAAQKYACLPGLLLLGPGVVLPLMFTAMALRSTFPRCPEAVYRAMELLQDWHASEVTALALLVTLAGLNSFPSLLAQTPGHSWVSAFYAVLLCGFSAWDLSTVQVPRILQAWRSGENGEALPLLDHEPEGETAGGQAGSPLQTLWLVLRQSLTGPVLLTKATGWSVFLLICLLCPTLPQETLDTINVKLRENLPMINRALVGALPESVGACQTAPPPCLERGMLYSYRSRLYEVDARWIGGLRSTELQSVVLSAPRVGRLALSLQAVVHSLPMSLRIAQCVTPNSWFSNTCSTLWDNTEACCGEQRHLQAVFLANCSEEAPYITGMMIQAIEVEALPVRENILGGLQAQVADVSKAAANALRLLLLPFLEGARFIPLTVTNVTLAELVTRTVTLNTGASRPFHCPEPKGSPNVPTNL